MSIFANYSLPIRIPEPVLAHFPDFSANRDISLGERLAQAKAERTIAWRESVDGEKRSLDYRAVRLSQFEVIACFQA